jgi:nucleoid-associated protein YgaU
VVTGDTLSRYAKQFYANANKWRKIFEANGEPSEPRPHHPGQVLKIR